MTWENVNHQWTDICVRKAGICTYHTLYFKFTKQVPTNLPGTNTVAIFFRDMGIVTRVISQFKSPERLQAPLQEDRIVLPNKCFPNSLGLITTAKTASYSYEALHSLWDFSDIFSLWILKTIFEVGHTVASPYYRWENRGWGSCRAGKTAVPLPAPPFPYQPFPLEMWFINTFCHWWS